MTILNYLISENKEMFFCGLRVLGVDEDLIKQCSSRTNAISKTDWRFADFFLNEEVSFFTDPKYDKIFLEIINQVSHCTVKHKGLITTIKFIKLKEVNYD